MDTNLIIAFIGIFSSLTIAIISAALSLRNGKKVELIKGEIAKAKSLRDARLDYEYEARKKLYNDYEPLKFQLFETAELALGRIKGLAIIHKLSTQKEGAWDDIKNYYFNESLFKLFLPITIFNLIKRKLTFVDIRLDRELFVQYSLLKILYYSFQEEFKIAQNRNSEFDIEYLKKWELDYQMPSGEFRRQGISSFYLDRISKAFLIDNNKEQRLLDYEEFESMVQSEDSEVLARLESGIRLFKGFNIPDNPLLWPLLISHAGIYFILLELKRKPEASLDEILIILDIFFEIWDKKYSKDAPFEQHYSPSKYAKSYLKKRIVNELNQKSH